MLLRGRWLLIAVIGVVSQLGVFSQSGVASAQGFHAKDTLETVRKSLDEKKAVLLDVRSKAEWDKGHLQDAISVPVKELSDKVNDKAYAEKLEKKIGKDKIVYCHCESGQRVLLAAIHLQKLGYNVRPLKPGYKEFLEAGFKKAGKGDKDTSKDDKKGKTGK